MNYERYEASIEDGNYQACFDAAALDGRSREEAESCSEGELRCTMCPFDFSPAISPTGREAQMEDLLSAVLDCGDADLDVLFAIGVDLAGIVQDLRECGEPISWQSVYRRSVEAILHEEMDEGYDPDDWEIHTNFLSSSITPLTTVDKETWERLQRRLPAGHLRPK